MSNQSDNKRIAKNTLLLYLRMFYTLLISLFTSRVILDALGFTDYGIYNVVGSVVAMFVFLRSALGNATHRFITYSLGIGDYEKLNKVFSTAVFIHFSLAVLIVILAETIGIWFLNEKMVIPEERMTAALWCYQFSVLSCFMTVICVPYDAEIIAHEKINIFAYVQIFNITINLGIAYIISHTGYDRLILYGFLILMLQVLNRAFYGFYCGRHFSECHFKWSFDKGLIKEMTSFAGWSMFGNLAYICYTQGLNLLLNMFFGPIVNTARGIAVHVQGAIKGFVTNFQTAVNPQIIKSYAKGDYDRLHFLVFASSKFSFYLLLCIVLPVIVEVRVLLNIWLKEVPDYTVCFTILTLLIMLVDPLSGPLDRANMATGKIRTYQIVEGGSLLFILPVSYIFLRNGGNPYSVFIVQLIIMYIVQLLRVFIVCHKIKMSRWVYVKKVLIPVIIVAVSSSIIPIIFYVYLPQSIISFFVIVTSSIISVLSCSYILGLNSSERMMINAKVNSAYAKLINRFRKTEE